MFLDDLPRPKTATFPRNLENLSIDELQAYIQDLEEEIERVKQDIGEKRASIEAAAAFFRAED